MGVLAAPAWAEDEVSHLGGFVIGPMDDEEFCPGVTTGQGSLQPASDLGLALPWFVDPDPDPADAAGASNRVAKLPGLADALLHPDEQNQPVSFPLLHLRALGEPDLSGGAPADLSVIRLLLLRSFHEPILVRIEVRGDSGHVLVKRLTGDRGWTPECGERGFVPGGPCRWRPGESGDPVGRTLEAGEWAPVEEGLKKVLFHDLPHTFVSPPPPPHDRGERRVIQLEEVCVDGSTWVLEGWWNGRYRAVSRDCVMEADMRALLCHILYLPGLDIGPVY
jgi:hypothetical protein